MELESGILFLVLCLGFSVWVGETMETIFCTSGMALAQSSKQKLKEREIRSTQEDVFARLERRGSVIRGWWALG